MIKIAIGDDQALLCESLANILDFREEFSVVSKGSNGTQVLSQCKKYNPDVVLMDIRMPLMDGIEATKKIKCFNNDIRVIVFTTFDSEENVIRAIASGADGYITKELSPEQLFLAIKCVHSGLKVFARSGYGILKEKCLSESKEKPSYQGEFSEEEVKIIAGVSNGKNNREIAEDLCIAEGTLKNKLSRIYKKTDVDDRVSLAVFAIDNGLV